MSTKDISQSTVYGRLHCLSCVQCIMETDNIVQSEKLKCVMENHLKIKPNPMLFKVEE